MCTQCRKPIDSRSFVKTSEYHFSHITCFIEKVSEDGSSASVASETIEKWSHVQDL